MAYATAPPAGTKLYDNLAYTVNSVATPAPSFRPVPEMSERRPQSALDDYREANAKASIQISDMKKWIKRVESTLSRQSSRRLKNAGNDARSLHRGTRCARLQHTRHTLAAFHMYDRSCKPKSLSIKAQPKPKPMPMAT